MLFELSQSIHLSQLSRALLFIARTERKKKKLSRKFMQEWSEQRAINFDINWRTAENMLR